MTKKPASKSDLDLVLAASSVVGQFASNNPVPFAAVPDLIRQVHKTMTDLLDEGPRVDVDNSLIEHQPPMRTLPKPESKPEPQPQAQPETRALNASEVNVSALLASPSPVHKTASNDQPTKGVNQFRAEYVMSEPQQQPAVPIVLSVWKDRIFCLECGNSFAAIKRHLKTTHKMDEKDYRLKFGLSTSYPMNCEEFTDSRRALIKQSGFKPLSKAEIAAKKRGEEPRARNKPTTGRRK